MGVAPHAGTAAGKNPGKTARRKKLKLTLAQRATLLADPGLRAAWGIKRVEEEEYWLQRKREELAGRPAPRTAEDDPEGGTRGGLTCSRRWFDDVWHHGQAYPPPLMQGCRGCGAAVPAHYLGSSGHCLDCRMEGLGEEESRNLPQAHSVIDFRSLRAARQRGESGAG